MTQQLGLVLVQLPQLSLLQQQQRQDLEWRQLVQLAQLERQQLAQLQWQQLAEPEQLGQCWPLQVLLLPRWPLKKVADQLQMLVPEQLPVQQTQGQ
mmetsp:Transcript_116449/g.211867  ORF Transcript_116449/g.211867 Transcript_116449/m.211867 type:complete len:96 (-) Transcript_116449:90-377(-)